MYKKDIRTLVWHLCIKLKFLTYLGTSIFVHRWRAKPNMTTAFIFNDIHHFDNCSINYRIIIYKIQGEARFTYPVFLLYLLIWNIDKHNPSKSFDIVIFILLYSQSMAKSSSWIAKLFSDQ